MKSAMLLLGLVVVSTSLEHSKTHVVNTRAWQRTSVHGPPVPKINETKVPCTTDEDCNHGKCGTDKQCACDKEYASLPNSGANVTAVKGCNYKRNARGTAIILHVLFGNFGAGAFCE